MKKGYSLIELLVAIGISALLFAAVVVSYTKAQAKARDARRKMDLAAIRVALESYFTQHNTYPAEPGKPLYAGEPELTFGGQLKDNSTGEVYLKIVPNDPKSPSVQYCYTRTENSLNYTLGARFESEASTCAGSPTPTPSSTTNPNPSASPNPTLPPGGTPSPSPVPTPTVNPLACLPCSSLGVNSCCQEKVYSGSGCTGPLAGIFLGCSDPCTKIWHQIGPLGLCANLTTQGLAAGSSCGDEAFTCGQVTNICNVANPDPDSYCDVSPFYNEKRNFTTCICW